MVVCIGIDSSYQSPAVSIQLENGDIHIICIQQRKKHTPCYNHKLNQFVFLHVIDKIENIDTDNLFNERWMNIRHNIDSILDRIKQIIGSCQSTVYVFIEGYAFNEKDSSSVTLLAEIAGIFKYQMLKLGYLVFEIPPKTVKKNFSGSGLATKADMIKHYHTKIHMPQFPYSFNPNTHPYDDAVDSYAIMYVGRLLHLTPIKTKLKPTCNVSHKRRKLAYSAASSALIFESSNNNYEKLESILEENKEI
jgi:Holliday junction resolvasome RuvABC endonuclease subunit